MNLMQILLILVAAVLLTWTMLCFIEKSSLETLGITELEIHDVEIKSSQTRLIFRDVELPSGGYVPDLDVLISNETYQQLRNRKQFRIQVLLTKTRGYVRGEFHSFATP